MRVLLCEKPTVSILNTLMRSLKQFEEAGTVTAHVLLMSKQAKMGCFSCVYNLMANANSGFRFKLCGIVSRET